MYNLNPNLSIIVFSKDRPLQLHAYLESLHYFSKIPKSNITVLYKSTAETNYKKLLQAFLEVVWIEEKSFFDDLTSIINNSSNFILFGCDDVIFKDSMDITVALSVLEKQQKIFGFSLRLGENINPLPENIEDHGSHLEWNWLNTKAPHWNYPWELDCTIYRKEDVKSIFSRLDISRIKNPNYLESDVALSPEYFIDKTKMASFKTGKAIVLTVNRVQDDFVNDFDKTLQTDIKTLYQVYVSGSLIDFKRIAKKSHKRIHVGVEYFKLTGKRNFYNSFAVDVKIFYNKTTSYLKRWLY